MKLNIYIYYILCMCTESVPVREGGARNQKQEVRETTCSSENTEAQKTPERHKDKQTDRQTDGCIRLKVCSTVYSKYSECVLVMDGVCEDDLCWLQLDDFRMLLIKTIEPSRITPYLRQCQVFLLQLRLLCLLLLLLLLLLLTHCLLLLHLLLCLLLLLLLHLLIHLLLLHL